MGANKTTAKSKLKMVGQKSGSTLKSLLDGSILVREFFIQSIPFMIYLAFVGSTLIANTYVAERNSRRVEQLTKEVTELRIKHKLTKSDLMYLTNQSEVTRRLATRGLQPSTVPPTRIKKENKSKGLLNRLFN